MKKLNLRTEIFYAVFWYLVSILLNTLFLYYILKANIIGTFIGVLLGCFIGNRATKLENVLDVITRLEEQKNLTDIFK